MIKKGLVLALILLMAAAVAYANTVVNSKHDMRNFVAGETSTQVCVYCHTPHQSTLANAQDPLWNHSVTLETVYGVYSSSTFNATATDIGTGNVGAGTQNVSLLCMGCHDGTTAVNSLYKQPLDGTSGVAISLTSASSAYLGTNLTDDHPVNFAYDAALVAADGGTGLNTPVATNRVDNTVPWIPLFTSTVQCGSCHNVHDNQYGPFLRATNVGSGLCLRCHIK